MADGTGPIIKAGVAHTPFSDGLRSIFGAGKKGGTGSGATPSESPNTLQSNAIVRVVEALSEGEIRGPAIGGDWLKSTFFDNVPVKAADGTVNLPGVTIDARLGLPDQDPLEGFPVIETTVAVSTQVLHATPLVKRISNLDCDAVLVCVQLSALAKQDTKTGNLTGYNVNFKFDIKADADNVSSVYVQKLNRVISGKQTGPYQEVYRLPLDGVGPWDVKMTRVSADDAVVTNQSETYWSYYVEQVDRKMIYPDTALIGVTANAKIFGDRIATRSVEIDGLLWDIPDNYDPDTRNYTGSWAGTFNDDWTNNPAWVLNGLMTRPRFGLGDLFAQSDIDKWTLYTLAKYNDAWRRRYSGAVGFTLGGVGRVDDTFTKTTGVANTWDSQAYSTVSYTGGAGAQAKPTATTKGLMFGLNSDPTTNANFTSLDYAWYVKPNGKLEVWASNVLQSSVDAWSYAIGDKLAVIYDNDYVRFYQNSTLRHSINVAAGLTLFFDSSFYSAAAELTAVSFGPDTACGCEDDYEAIHGRHGVPDGSGGYEPRFTINYPLNTRTDAFKVLQSIGGMMRSALLWTGGQIGATQDSPKSAIKTFSPANVIDGLFNYTGTSESARHTVAYVTWNNPDKNYEPDIAVVEDRLGVARYGYVDIDLTAFGCTSYGQAIRTGLFVLATERLETDTVQFKIQFEHADLVPGEIIKITDPIYTEAEMHGRTVSATTLKIVMDRPFQYEAGRSYKINFYTPDGTFALDVPLSNPGNVLSSDATFASAISGGDVPVANAAFAIESDEVEARYFRVMKVSEEEKGIYRITALQYDALKFDDIDEGVLTPASPSDFSNLANPAYAAPPENLSFSYHVQLIAGAQRGAVKIEWDPPADTIYTKDYVLRYQLGDDNWREIKDIKSPEYTILDPDLDVLRVIVYAVNFANKRSTPLAGAHNLASGNFTGKNGVVHTLQLMGGSTTQWIDRQISFSWKFRSPYTLATATLVDRDRDPYLDKFKIELCTGGTDTVIATFYTTALQFAINLDRLQAATIARSYRLKVYAIDDKGNASVADVINITNPAPALPSMAMVVTPRSVTLQMSQPADADFAGYRVWMSTGSGFTPSSANLVWEGPGNPVIPVNAGTVYYLKYAAFDAFAGATGTTTGLTVSTEQTVTPTAEKLPFDFARSSSMTIGDGSATKTGGGSGAWDSQVYSVPGFIGGAYASASPAQTSHQIMFGLNRDPTTDASYAGLDYCWFFYSGGVQIYESGASVYTGTYAAGDTFYVSYDGYEIRYYQNGVLKRSVAATISVALYFDSSFYEIGGKLNAIQFGVSATRAEKLPFDFVRSSGITIGDGSATKTGGVNNTYDNQVYSVVGFKGGAYASASPAATNGDVIFGLNADPTTDANWSGLDYTFYCNAVGSLYIYESGALALSLGSYAAGDTLDVSYDGYEVRYYWNGKMVRKVQATITAALYFDSSFYTIGARLNGIQFGKGPSPVGASLDFDAVATTNMAIAKHVARKTGATNAWDAAIYSVVGYTGGANASVSPAQNDKSIMFGLNSDPTTNDSYTSIDYAWYLRTTGAAEVYESGSLVQTGWTYVAGDTFDVSYDGFVIVYYKNGRVCRSVQVSITAPLYFDSSFYTQNGELRGIAFRKGPAAFGEDLGFPNLYTETMALGRNSAKKVSGSNAWDAQVCSLTGYVGGVHCSVVADGSTQSCFGLNTDPFTDASYSSIDYAFSPQIGTLYILESGANPYTGSYAAGDTLSISYDGRAIRYYKNGVVIRSVAATITTPLYFDSSFYLVGSKLDAIQFGKGALGAANDIAPSQAGVTAGNLIQDPHFTDMAYWSLGTATTVSTDSTNIKTPLNAPQGLDCNLTGVASGAILGAIMRPVAWMHVQPSFWYRVRMATRYTIGFTGVWAIYVQWRDQAGAAIGSPVFLCAGTNKQTVAAVAAATEQLDSAPTQAPSNARYADVQWVCGASTTLGNAGHGYCASPIFEQYKFGSGWTVVTGVSGYASNINPLSAADVGATATISVAAFNLVYPDNNGISRTTAYSAGSITGRAFSTTYYIFAFDPGGAGGAVTYVSATSTSAYAADVNYVFIGSVLTPANGAGGTSGGYRPPSGDYCISVDAFVAYERRAGDALLGDLLEVLDDAGAMPKLGYVHRAEPIMQPGVRLWSESGVALAMSVSTPITQPDGSVIRAMDAYRAMVAVVDDDGFRWERVVRCDSLGEIEVMHIDCGDGTFAAGDDPSRRMFTHNKVFN